MQQHDLEARVQTELESDEPVDQDEFVRSLSERSDIDKQHVLGALRALMERDKVSYTIDYNLQTQDDL
jgi:hypothetical protein